MNTLVAIAPSGRQANDTLRAVESIRLRHQQRRGNNLSMAARPDDAHIETEWTMLRCLGIGSKRGRYGQTIRAQERPAQTSNPVAMPGRVLGASRYESLSVPVAKPGQDRPMLLNLPSKGGFNRRAKSSVPANVERCGQAPRGAANFLSTWLVRLAEGFSVTRPATRRTAVELGGGSALKGGR